MNQIMFEDIENVRYNFKTIQKISWVSKPIWFYLKPKSNEENINVIFDNNWFYLTEDFNQDESKNIHFWQHEYKWNKKEKSNLKYIHSIAIDIDIWEEKRCKNKNELENRLFF